MRNHLRLLFVGASCLVLSLAGGTAQLERPALAGSGTPAFVTYTAPSALFDANNAAEPSTGIDLKTGAVLYQAGTSTFKVLFDRASPANATWTDVSIPSSVFNLDPILATDAVTGRSFAGGLASGCSVLSYTDNDGGSWSQMGNACSAADHETIGSGPYAGGAPAGATYQRVVYYCAQTGSDLCATSTNGGVTFGAPTTVGGACGGLHGHVKVSADGTAYLPNANCGSRTGGGITRNNGGTWSSYTIAASDSPGKGFDPSVATTPDNTVYESWMAGSLHPMVARSIDHGASWDRVTDLAGTVSPPLVATTFQAVVAGDNGRVAVAYLGTQTGSNNPFTNGYHGIWYLYVSYSYDGGQTWVTVRAAPDPVQRGCIWDAGGSNPCRNLADFMNASLTADGRVLVGYADGCINTCATANGTEAQSTSAYATITRQSAGRGLFAAFDGTSTATSPSGSTPGTSLSGSSPSGASRPGGSSRPNGSSAGGSSLLDAPTTTPPPPGEATTPPSSPSPTARERAAGVHAKAGHGNAAFPSRALAALLAGALLAGAVGLLYFTRLRTAR